MPIDEDESTERRISISMDEAQHFQKLLAEKSTENIFRIVSAAAENVVGKLSDIATQATESAEMQLKLQAEQRHRELEVFKEVELARQTASRAERHLTIWLSRGVGAFIAVMFAAVAVFLFATGETVAAMAIISLFSIGGGGYFFGKSQSNKPDTAALPATLPPYEPQEGDR